MFLDDSAFDVDDVDKGFSRVKVSNSGNNAHQTSSRDMSSRDLGAGDNDEDGGGFGSAGALAPQASSRARMLAQQRELQARRRASQMQNAGMVRSSRDSGGGDNSPYERGGGGGGTGDYQHTPAMPQFSAPKMNTGGSGRHGPGGGADGGGGFSPDSGGAGGRQSEFSRPARPMSSSGQQPRGQGDRAPIPPSGGRHGYRDGGGREYDDADADHYGGPRNRGSRDADVGERDRDNDRRGSRLNRGGVSQSSGGDGYNDDYEDGYGDRRGGGGRDGWSDHRGGRGGDRDRDRDGGRDDRDYRGGGRDDRDRERNRNRGAGSGNDGRRKGAGYDDDEDEDDYAINRGKRGGGGKGRGYNHRYEDEDDIDKMPQGKGNRGGAWEQGGGGDPRSGQGYSEPTAETRDRERTPPPTAVPLGPAGGPNTPAPASALNLTNMRAFLTSPLPRKGVVQCYIRRNKSGTNKLYPVYTLYLVEGDRFLMQSKKRANNTTSNYLITMGENDFGRDSVNYLGKLRSNFVGTEFQVFDNGCAPKDGSAKDEGDERGGANVNPRKELAAVMYAPNVMGSKGPRKMQAAIPAVGEQDGAVTWRSGQERGGGVVDDLINRIKDRNNRDIIYMINKPPRWNEQVGAYVLNFNGRVTMASVKNFQLVDPDDQNSVILQFGRVANNEFTMDMKWPISPLQAFAITLSSFDSKIACD